MKPFDSRLLRYASSVRTVLAAGAVAGLLRAIAIIAWCWFLSQAIAAVAVPVLGGLGGDSGRIGEGAQPTSSLPLLLTGAGVAALIRALAGWALDALATRGAIRAKSQLRHEALDALDARSPEWTGARADTEFATMLGRGLDALDGYFASYLPQLILTVVSTPLIVIAVLWADLPSGITVLIVFPVIPLFMVLIGLATRSVQRRQWQQLQHLSASYLDVIEGLATLKIFRREGKQIRRIAAETGEYRSRTMQVLRVTFMSGFVLDLAGTFSIALVAVSIGTRLVAGEFSLALGLFVLLLLPEAFVPIRQVGAAFHQSTEGLEAAQNVFAVIEAPGAEPSAAASSFAAAPHGGIELKDLRVTRGAGTSIGPLSCTVRPGELVALTGPSGAGKSSVIAALLGFVTPSSGEILRPERIAWTGQRPGLRQGTVLENVTLGSDAPHEAMARNALDRVGLQALAPDHPLGVLGQGVSGGQAQRIGIARLLYRAWTRGAEALVLDEPSSALDADSERIISDVLRTEAAAGRAVLVVSHRPALIAAADRTVELTASPVREVSDAH